MSKSQKEKEVILEQSKQAASQLRKFTALFLDASPKEIEKAKQKYLSYFMRIMGARMQPASFKDPNAIKSLITSKLSSSKQERLNGKSPEVK